MVSKFGVPPASIPDYLALVGDAADGYPGLRGWGPKSTAAVLAKFGHLEAIPEDPRTWSVNAANAATLAATFAREREQAFLFRDLATLRSDLPLFQSVDELEWRGPTPAFAAARRASRQGRQLSIARQSTGPPPSSVANGCVQRLVPFWSRRLDGSVTIHEIVIARPGQYLF